MREKTLEEFRRKNHCTHLDTDDMERYWYEDKQTIEAQAAEIAELKDEVENLNGELMFRPTYSKLTEQITELRKAIQAIDDIVYEECEHGMMAQIWAIIEGVKEVE